MAKQEVARPLQDGHIGGHLHCLGDTKTPGFDESQDGAVEDLPEESLEVLLDDGVDVELPAMRHEADRVLDEGPGDAAEVWDAGGEGCYVREGRGDVGRLDLEGEHVHGVLVLLLHEHLLVLVGGEGLRDLAAAVGEEEVMVLVAVLGENVEKRVDGVAVAVEGDAEKADIVLDKEEVVGRLHPGELVLQHRHHLGDGGLPEGVDVGTGDEAAAGAEDAILDDKEAGDLSEEGLVRLEEGGQGGDLEVGGELQLAVLEVVTPEALLEAEGLVDVVGAVERGEIETRVALVGGGGGSGRSEVVGVVAGPVVVLLDTEGVGVIAEGRGGGGGAGAEVGLLLGLALTGTELLLALAGG